VTVKNVRYIDILELARQCFSFDSNKLGSIAGAIVVEAELRRMAMSDVLVIFSAAVYIYVYVQKGYGYDMRHSVYE
jgi:hypothetical protein